MWGINLISSGAICGHVFLFTAHSFCLISITVTVSDTECKSIRNEATQKPTVHHQQVYCRTYGHIKGFEIREMGLYFPCSESSCPGVFGCEACCFDHGSGFDEQKPRDPKTPEANGEETATARTTGQNTEWNLDHNKAAGFFKSKVRIAFLTAIALLGFIAGVVFMRLFCVIYCEKRESGTDEKGGQNKKTPVGQGCQTTTTTEQGKTTTITKTTTTEDSETPETVHVTLCKAGPSKCESVPKNKAKLNGRSCKVCPKGTTSIRCERKVSKLTNIIANAKNKCNKYVILQ